MNFIKRMLRLAREHDSWSSEAKGFESSALTSIKALVSFWADEYTLRGDKMKGQELDEIFKEDEKLRKESD